MDVPPADVEVVAADGLGHRVEADVVGEQPARVDADLVLLMRTWYCFCSPPQELISAVPATLRSRGLITQSCRVRNRVRSSFGLRTR
jgi:hypothetical protein